jgi:hypothetical protein
MARKQAKKPKVSTNTSAKDFRELGADIMNRSTGGSEGIFDTRWIAHFGAEPEVCVEVWSRLEKDDALFGPNGEEAFPCHLLWALLFLKTYDTEPVLAGMCGACDEDTLRKWSWEFVEKVSDLEDQVVSLIIVTPCRLLLSLILLLTALCFECGVSKQIIFENRLVDDVGNDCLIQIDATDCETENQGECLAAFFSHKFKSSGLRYELATNIRTGDFVWICGPFPPGDWPDLEIFRWGLKGLLRDGERVEADDGYKGEDPLFTKVPAGARYMEDTHWNMKRNKVRNRGETLNHRLKTFKVLGGTFRHDIEKHSMCFRACAVLVQLSFEVGSKKLFPVDNYDQSWMDTSRAPFPDGN